MTMMMMHVIRTDTADEPVPVPVVSDTVIINFLLITSEQAAAWFHIILKLLR